MASTKRPRNTKSFTSQSLVLEAGRAPQSACPRPCGEEVKEMQRISAWAHSHFVALRAREEGQTMAEYGVVLALITALVAFAFTSLGQAIITKIGVVTGILSGGS